LIIAVPKNNLAQFANFKSELEKLKTTIPGVDKITVEVKSIDQILGI
jgi:nicotinate-nucleotide pyrophosphorylase